ncbi:MAG: glutathione S-transferase family protein [Alphaproteobacteria bacterium]
MKLYSAALSLFGRKIEIALAEKGLDFERVQVPFSQAEGYTPRHPAVLAANPKRQVPVLVDGDLVLYDSTVILEYLEDAFPSPPLYPREPAERARCRLAELFADEVMLVPLRSLMYRNERPVTDPQRLQDLKTGARDAEGVIARHYAELDGKLAGNAFLFPAFSAADIGTFLMVHYAQRLAGPAVGDFPMLDAWYRRLAARPAFQVAISEIAAADKVLSFPVDIG